MCEHLLEYQFNAEETKLFDLYMFIKCLFPVEEGVKAESLPMTDCPILVGY
jgi:hypothetical protein